MVFIFIKMKDLTLFFLFLLHSLGFDPKNISKMQAHEIIVYEERKIEDTSEKKFLKYSIVIPKGTEFFRKVILSPRDEDLLYKIYKGLKIRDQEVQFESLTFEIEEKKPYRDHMIYTFYFISLNFKAIKTKEKISIKIPFFDYQYLKEGFVLYFETIEDMKKFKTQQKVNTYEDRDPFNYIFTKIDDSYDDYYDVRDWTEDFKRFPTKALSSVYGSDNDYTYIPTGAAVYLPDCYRLLFIRF